MGTSRLVFDHFKISDTDGTLLDLPGLMKLELRNDNVQSFGIRWDATVIAMKKKPDDEVLENLCYRQLDTADQFKQLLVLYIQNTVKKT